MTARRIPTSLRRPEERFAARHVADVLLRADARKQRAAATPKPDKKAAPTVTAGPQPLRLTDLKKAIAAKQRRFRIVTTAPAHSRAGRLF